MSPVQISDELKAFRAELKAAGEPWRQRGVKLVLIGFGVLVAAQILTAYALLLLYLAIAVFAAGWVFLVIAFVRRRRWAKGRTDLVPPELPPLP